MKTAPFERCRVCRQKEWMRCEGHPFALMEEGQLTFEEACQELEEVGRDEELECERCGQHKEHYAQINERRELAKAHLRAALPR